MRTLSRALLTSTLLLFAAVLSASLLAIAVIEIMLHFDDISARGGGPAAAWQWLRVRIPSYYLRDLIPLSTFAAAFLALGLPARRGELLGAMAGGVSPLALARPLLGAAALLSAAGLWLDETVVLDASRQWLRAESAARERFFPRGPFWYHRDGVVYNVGGAGAGSHTLRDVEIYELGPDGRLLRRIRAERARVAEDRRWHLEDATWVSFDPARPGAPPRVERARESVFEPAEPGSAPLPAGALSLRALGARLAGEGDSPRGERAALHGRLAEPLTPLLFAWMALPLAFGVQRRRSLSLQAVRGGVTLGLFYTARSLGSLLALAGAGWAVYAPWALLAGFAGLAGFQLARAGRH